jgi:hypothetical protein
MSKVGQCTATPKVLTIELRTCSLLLLLLLLLLLQECNCVSTPAATGKAFMLPKYGKGK